MSHKKKKMNRILAQQIIPAVSREKGERKKIQVTFEIKSVEYRRRQGWEDRAKNARHQGESRDDKGTKKICRMYEALFWRKGLSELIFESHSSRDNSKSKVNSNGAAIIH